MILRRVAKQAADIVVIMGNGAGVTRIDPLWVSVRMWTATGTITRARLPVEAASSDPSVPNDDQLPVEGQQLIAEWMGNHAPQRGELQIDVSCINRVST